MRARVEVPRNTLTQAPVVTAASGLRYGPAGAGAHPDLPGAVRLAIGRDGGATWPWRAALAGASRDPLSNGVNARIPATAGEYEVAVPIEGVAAGDALTVALVREGSAVGERVTVRAP